MEVDLAIIGGGYWGSAISLEARKLGRSVIVIDDGDRKAGSRNASAICDPNTYKSSVFKKYWPGDWLESELQESLSWLIDNGGILTQEYFWNKFQGREPRLGSKAIYLPDNSLLIRNWAGKVLHGKIESITSGKRFELGIKGCKFSISCRQLVVAAGYRTSEVLSLLGTNEIEVGSLYGRGILARGYPSTDIPISVMIKPYVKHTVRSWGKFYRVGDTAEIVEKDSKFINLQEVGRGVLNNYREVEVISGYRPTYGQFLVVKLAKNLVVATGGNRVGLGLLGLVAKKSLRMLK